MMRSTTKRLDQSPSGIANIQSFFCGSQNRRIFCTLIGDPGPSKECVIYFPPLFEERMWSQRIAFNFARDLVARGRYAVLIFDYYGYGESDGKAEEFCIAGCQEDVETLIETLQTRGFSSFVLWGIRTGCVIALASIVPMGSISSAVLWAPVLNLKEYIFDCLRANMTTQLSMFKQVVAKRDVILQELIETGNCSRKGYLLNNIEGYGFGQAFYHEVIKLNHGPKFDQLSFPVLVAEIVSAHTQNEKKEQIINNPKVQTILISERKFWLIGRDYSQTAETLYRATYDWLDKLVKPEMSIPNKRAM